MRRLAKFILVPGVALLAACGPTKRDDRLNLTLEAYQHAVRWEGFANADLFVDPAVRAKHPLTPLDLQRYAQISISDYDEGQGPMPMDADHVRQTVTLGIVNNHTQGSRTIVDHQIWKYDVKTDHWWLESGLPDITQN